MGAAPFYRVHRRSDGKHLAAGAIEPSLMKYFLRSMNWRRTGTCARVSIIECDGALITQPGTRIG
jgi:hypothetical protein